MGNIFNNPVMLTYLRIKSVFGLYRKINIKVNMFSNKAISSENIGLNQWDIIFPMVVVVSIK